MLQYGEPTEKDLEDFSDYCQSVRKLETADPEVSEFSESEPSIDIDDMPKLYKSLFKISSDCTRYAVTVNVQPTRLMNKRQWKLYTHEQQRGQLFRLEGHLRKLYPNIELIEIRFEICPTLKNVHFHALYNCRKADTHDMITYWQSRVGTIKTKTTKDDKFSVWRHLDIQEVYDNQGWLLYIQKDALKPA